MPKKRTTEAVEAHRTPPGPPPRPSPASWALAAAVLAPALLVDVSADAAFDAPKRLALLLALAAAAFLQFGLASRRPRAGDTSPGPVPRTRRLLVVLLVFVLTLTLASALAAPRRGPALDAARTMALVALLLPLGASSALEGRGGWRVVAAFLGGAAANGALSALQRARLWQPFPAETLAGRANTGGFLGNEGVLSLLAALAAVAAAGLLVSRRRARRAERVGLVAVLLVSLLAVALNRNVTSFLVLAAGGAALGVLLARRRAVAVGVVALALAFGAFAGLAVLRGRFAKTWRPEGVEGWNRVVSYRLGPWAAAVEMVRERPLLGFGPGSFGAEFVPRRLAAELRLSARLTNPWTAGSYAEAHSDLLQAAAELGVPAACAAGIAAALLLAALARSSGRGEADAAEAALLFAFLLAGSVAALTWFPFQRGVTAAPLLLAAGRAWRLAR